MVFLRRLRTVTPISGRAGGSVRSFTGTTIGRVQRSRILSRAVFWLGVLAAVGMMVVLVMGARVTSTGSAQGCGRDWPLCNGRLVPDFTFAAAIEFSHRAVTGVEGVLIVAFTVAVWALYRDRRPVRVLAPLML